MDSPTDQHQDPDQGAPSPSTSDIENYTRDLLERARARSKLIGQVQPPLKERPVVPVPVNTATVEEEAQQLNEISKDIVQKADESCENDTAAEEKDDTLKTVNVSQHAEPAVAPTALAPAAQNDMYEMDTPFKKTTRSTRLTMLARTINEWEDDLSRAPITGHRGTVNAPENQRSLPVYTPPPPALALVSPPKSPVKKVEVGSPMLGGPRSPPKSPPKQVQFAKSPPRQVQLPKSPSPPKQMQGPAAKSPPKQMSVPISKSPSKAALESRPDHDGRDPSAVIRPGTVSQHRLLFEPAGGRPTERGPLNIVKGSVQEKRMAFEKGNVTSARPSSPVNRPSSPVRGELMQEGTRTINKLFGNASALAKEAQGPAVAPSPPPMPPASKRPHSPTSATPNNNTNYPGLSGLKKLKPTPSPPKPGNIYPSLTDIECDTEQEQDMDDSGESLGCFIEKVAKSASGTPMQMQMKQTPTQGQDRENTCTVTMAIGSALDALDDALEGEDYTLDTVMEDPTITSSPIVRPAAAPVTMTTPLLHTVSFYRRSQQQQTPSAGTSAASKAAARKQLIVQEEPEPDDEEEQERVNEEIRELETQVGAQTRAIAQASKALNLCSSSMEFADSTERVECERVLMLATNRRSALLTHIQNLRTEAVLGRPTYLSTATLSMGRIRIQTPRSSNAQQMMRLHHYVLLARCGQNVEASEVVQREEESGGLLEFKGFRLQGLNKDFRLVLELYRMETGREWLSHDAKYRIASSSSKKGTTLTPSKKHHQHQHLALQSPAGPQAVLSSSFTLQGSLTLVIGDLHKKQFQMVTSSASGWGLALEMEMQATATCSVRHSGYLALFEDVNGLGCWVRRWALLGGGLIQFWMYEGDAEDENKPPTTTISLASITTSTIRPPAPSVCARSNSIFMESVRDRRNSDKPSLTTELSGSMTRVKWLLAADSKQEREEWLENLNAVLEEHRRWQ